MKKEKKRHSLATFIIMGLILMILVMEIGAGIIGYYEFDKSLTEQYQKMTGAIAETASHTLNAEKLDTYLETGSRDAEYEHTYEEFQNMVNSSDAGVLYVAKIDAQKGTRTYIYNVVGKNFGEPYPLGYVNKASDNIIEGYKTLLDNEAGIENYMYTSNDANGKTTTTLVPIYKDGEITAVCSIVMPMTILKEGRDNIIIKLTVFSILLAFIVGFICYYLMRKKIIMPLRYIADETLRFSENRAMPDERLIDKIKEQTEIGDLAQSVDDMEKTIVAGVDKLVKMTAEKNRIGAELNIASDIQLSTLPRITDSFPGRKEVDAYAVMKPAKEVGGDFYDLFFIDDDHIAMVIADVSGKGVPSALFMMIAKLMIKIYSMNGNYDAGEILSQVNDKLCEDNNANMFVTVWLGILELSTGTVYASNAGHEFPVVSDKDGNFKVMEDEHGFILGIMDGVEEETYTFKLEKGEALLVFTDGVTEAVNNNKEMFGRQSIIDVLNMEKTTVPKEIIETVLKGIDDFVKDEEQFDDTTMICIRYNGVE